MYLRYVPLDHQHLSFRPFCCKFSSPRNLFCSGATTVEDRLDSDLIPRLLENFQNWNNFMVILYSDMYKFCESTHANFLNRVFHLNAQAKWNFDFEFGIIVKFLVEWCIWVYNSSWICLRFLNFVQLHAYAKTISRGNVAKFKIGNSYALKILI